MGEHAGQHVGSSTQSPASAATLPPVQSRQDTREQTPAHPSAESRTGEQTASEPSKQATPMDVENSAAPAPTETNGSLKHDLEEKADDKTLKKPSVSKGNTPQPNDANSQQNGAPASARPEQAREPEKPSEPVAATKPPGPASAPGPGVNPQPIVTGETSSSNSTAPPKFSSAVTENEKKEENEKDNENDEEDEEKKNEPVEPPLRKVEEDENYDDE